MGGEVTVCIPTTARPDFLRSALHSVRNQTLPGAIGEVVVSENKQDRRSEAVVREFPDLPIRYILREPSLPMLPHLRLLFQDVHTPYVAMLNDDDWWCSGHVADGLNALKRTPDAVAFVAASVFTSDETAGNPRWIDRSAAVWLFAGQPSWLTLWSLPAPAMLALCWVYTPFHWSSLIGRTEDMQSSFDALVKHGHTYTADRLTFGHLCQRGTFLYNPVPDTFVRWHDSSWTLTNPEHERRATILSTSTLIQGMSEARGWNPSEIWKTALASMPASAEEDVLAKLQFTFEAAELRRMGLLPFFSTRPRSIRLQALRGLAGNAKRLMLGR